MKLLNKLKQKTQKKYPENNITQTKNIINNIDTGLGDEINKKIKNDINQRIDDCITKEYGTPEEKEALHQRKKQEEITENARMEIKEKIKKAKRMHDKNSIKIYEEIINGSDQFPDLTVNAYHGLIDTYVHIKYYNHALETINECIEFKKRHNQDCSYDEKLLKRVTTFANDSKQRGLIRD